MGFSPQANEDSPTAIVMRSCGHNFDDGQQIRAGYLAIKGNYISDLRNVWEALRTHYEEELGSPDDGLIILNPEDHGENLYVEFEDLELLDVEAA